MGQSMDSAGRKKTEGKVPSGSGEISVNTR